jgi:hypothetical protein
VPLAHGQDGGIPALLELGAYLGVRHKMFLSELRLCSFDDP